MRSYYKDIEITSTGMVVASVFRSDGNRVGLKFFTQLFPTIRNIKKSANKAHKWADSYIVMCTESEYKKGGIE